MRVVFKTLMNDQFEMNLDENSPVSTLKQQISALHPDFTAENIKLVSAGRVLSNDQTLSGIKFKEGSFIVIFDKEKKDAKPSLVAVDDLSTNVSASSTEPSSTTPTVESPRSSTVPQDSSRAVESQNVDDLLGTAEEREKVIVELMEMGFDRESVTLALNASFFNPDRAVEYLLSGNIPPVITEINEPLLGSSSTDRHPPTVEEIADEASSAPSSTNTTINTSRSSSHVLDALRLQPHFQELRRVIRQNPEMLTTVLSSIGQTHPELLEAIEENEEQFLQMLTQDTEDPSSPAAPSGSLNSATAVTGGEDSQEGSSHVVILSADERAAINRLMELGFNENACVQAYFACDKNENDAANFLFSADMDDADDPTDSTSRRNI